MPPAPLPVNEVARLRALLEYDILDSPAEESFDRITRMVGEMLDLPIVLVSLVDKDRQWFKSRYGFEGRESSRDSAFCAHTILGDEPLIVKDARSDPRFSDSPLVVGSPYIRFYAGVPLKSASGYNLGTLCAISLKPRELAAREVELMLRFADVLGDDLALRLALKHLRENHERLLHSEKMAGLGRFAARLAHEINTPVHFLSGTMDFFRESFASLTTLLKAYEGLRSAARSLSPETVSAVNEHELDSLIEQHEMGYLLEEVPMALDHASDGIARITDLVSSMKMLAHPASCPHLPADLNEAIRTTAVISGAAWRHLCTLDLRLDADLPALSCNIAEINQVLMNMIVNSAHAIEERTQSGSPEPGRIVIETSVSENVVCIAIRDNGAGIPAEMETQIYDPEFTTKPPGKGTGLGLAIVKDIIENKHHGSVEFQSEVGIGTTFRIKLPIEGDESDFGVHCFGSLFSGQDRPCDE